MCNYYNSIYHILAHLETWKYLWIQNVISVIISTVYLLNVFSSQPSPDHLSNCCTYMLRLNGSWIEASVRLCFLNSVTSAVANTLERIQQKFAALCFNRFLSHVHYSYAYASENLKLNALRKRRYHIDGLFLI
jgi:hypothetical protein